MVHFFPNKMIIFLELILIKLNLLYEKDPIFYGILINF